MDRNFYKYQEEYENKALEVLRSGWYVLGNELVKFEEEFAAYIGTKYCVGLASGLDALWMAFRILKIGKGDEVIVQGNTYIASVMGITLNGATPIFVEPDECYGIDAEAIEKKITNKTKAILVVHLYGMVCQMDKIVYLCQKYNLKLVEDCAQSHGACFNGRKTGTFGDVGCFSFYPSKNLGAFGDAGAVILNDEAMAQEFKVYRNYGSEQRYHNKIVGANSRLDEIQAGLLRVKLQYLDDMNNEREGIAKRYSEEIKNKLVKLPIIRDNTTCVWHQYVIRCGEREKLIEYLAEKGIDTNIHYPIPPHMSEAYRYLGYKEGMLPITEDYANTILSLPMYNGMTIQEVDYVVEAINMFE